MKLRIEGTEDECRDMAERLGRVADVVEVSRPYPNRTPSRLVRVYAEVRLAPPAGYGEDKTDA